MAYVYILSDYQAHGAENITASLDRGQLLKSAIKPNWRQERSQKFMLSQLAECLKKTDDELSAKESWELNGSWGGVMLHVVELK